MIPESSSPCIEDNSNYPTYMLKCILPGLNSNLRIYDIEENPLLKAKLIGVESHHFKWQFIVSYHTPASTTISIC